MYKKIKRMSVVSSCPQWVAVEDFNNDTALNIAIANYGADNVGVHLRHSNRSFTR
jgi:hypothetical protein